MKKGVGTMLGELGETWPEEKEVTSQVIEEGLRFP